MGILSRGMTRYPETIKEEARALFAAGMKPGAIAAKLGISGDVLVRRWCDEKYRVQHNEQCRRRYIPSRREALS